MSTSIRKIILGLKEEELIIMDNLQLNSKVSLFKA